MEKQNKVALDVNMIMAIRQFNIDIFSEIERILGKAEYFIPEHVSKEIEYLEKKGTKLTFEKELIKKKKSRIF